MRECSLERLIEAHPKGATVVDVREDHEYAAGHVPGAIHIPMDELSQRLDEVPADGIVYVICRSGRRSQLSAHRLETAGLDAYSVREGTLGWVQRGQPVVTGMSPG